MELRQLTVYEHVGCVNICAQLQIPLSFVDQSSPRRLGNFGDDIPTSPEVIEYITHLILSQILNFYD